MIIKKVVIMALLSCLLILPACSNQKEVQNTIDGKNDGKNTATFTVTEMYCSSCPFVIQSAIERVEGVNNVSIETEGNTGKVTVSFDDTKADLNTIQKVVSDLGYGVK